MPRPFLGPRLYFDQGRDQWAIRDGARFVRTGKHARAEAELCLAHYLGTKAYENYKAPTVIGFVYFVSAAVPDFPIKIGFTEKLHRMRRVAADCFSYLAIARSRDCELSKFLDVECSR